MNEREDHLNRYFEKRKCKVCGKTFFVRKKTGSFKGYCGIRPVNAKTCSKECARKNYQNKCDGKNGKKKEK